MEEARQIPCFRCESIEKQKLSQDWETWKGSLECYFEAYGITDQRMMKAKLLHLGGVELQRVFRSLPGHDKVPLVAVDPQVYDLAIELLDGYFQAGRQYVIERRKLRQIKQQEGEKFSHFVLRLRQQAKSCGFEKQSSEVSEILQEIYLIDVVVENCRSDDLRRSILKKDRSLSEIEEIAASIENTELQMLNLKGPSSVMQERAAYEISNVRNVKRSPPPTVYRRREDKNISRRPRESSAFDNHTNQNDQPCFACGQQGHFAKSFNCPARGRTCRRCKQLGHFEQMCRKRKFDTKVTAKPKRIYKVENLTKEETDYRTSTVENDQKEEKVYYAFYGGNQTNVLPGMIGGVSVQLLVDSGADANLIKPETWEMLKSKKVRVKSSVKGSSKVLKGYGSDQPLTIIGSFKAEIIVGKMKTDAEFFVVQGGQRDILGDGTAKQLGVLKVGLHVNEVKETKPFSKISGVQAEIVMKEHVKPVFQPLRRVPIPMEEAVNKKLEDLLDRDIIEVKQGPTTWVSPLVVVGKASGEPRICLDLRRVNEAIERERFPMPVVEEYLARLCHGKVWSKLDIKEAFHQVELAQESRDITTFITNRGLFRFKRLPFGLVSAPEIFQRIMEELLAGCEGTYWYLDDIIVKGETQEVHDKNLKKVLDKLKSRGVELNWGKCVFGVTELEFLGHRISVEGIRPSQTKVSAVLSFRPPASESEIRSFLGLASYLNKFIPNLATIAQPLRELTKKGAKFVWGAAQNNSFEEIKKTLAAASTLGFFDPSDRTAVVADASPTGLGAALVQTDPQGQFRIISYASKSLTDTERRYCQTEKEALALVWSVERFRMYLYGRNFDLVTDCKVLEFLFTSRSKPCARIERWVLRLQSFDYQIVHIPGDRNIADALSRLSTLIAVPFDPNEEVFIREVAVYAATASALKWEEIEEASRQDDELSEVVRMIRNDDHRKLPLAFKVLANELCVVDGVLMRVDRIIIPSKLRDRVLCLAHEGHPGMRLMKSHLRTNVWWPNMDQQVEKFVKQCKGCALVAAPSAPEPMIRKELPCQPWIDVAADFLGPLPDGQYLLVVIDYYSRYMEVVEMSSITAAETVAELAIIFSRYGLPVTLRVDNGPQFSEKCEEFRSFCDSNGIQIVNTIPLWPAMNGEVERQNRSLLKRLRIAQELGKDWRDEMRRYLLTYHSTNHTTTGKSPGELMFGRKIRNKLPQVPLTKVEDGEVRDRDMVMKEKGKVYADNKRKARNSGIDVGDSVMVKRSKKDNKLDTTFAPEEYAVVKKHGSDTTVRSQVTGKELRRNVAHLKKLEHPDNKDNDIQRNTKRMRMEPARYKDFIPH